MLNLSQMSYEEFGKLKFLDFFPGNERYNGVNNAGFESGIGLASVDGYSSTVFTSPVDTDWKTAGIDLDFSEDCPEVHGNALLKSLGLDLCKGMTLERVKQTFDTPITDSPTFLLFLVGEQWPYYVSCRIEQSKGLSSVWIGRKDLADEVS